MDDGGDRQKRNPHYLDQDKNFSRSNAPQYDNRQKVFEDNSEKPRSDDFVPLKTLKNLVIPTPTPVATPTPTSTPTPATQGAIPKKATDEKPVQRFEPKKITEENKNLLKEALQSVLKTTTPNIPKDDLEKEKKQLPSNQNIQNNRPKEISEETLRKMLEVKE